MSLLIFTRLEAGVARRLKVKMKSNLHYSKLLVETAAMLASKDSDDCLAESGELLEAATENQPLE